MNDDGGRWEGDFYAVPSRIEIWISRFNARLKGAGRKIWEPLWMQVATRRISRRR